MANGLRFFSTTTADKRSALENAWEDANENLDGKLREQLRANLRDSQGGSDGGSVLQSSSSNGHSGSYAEPGTGAPAPIESVRLWQDLVDRYDTAFEFVSFCAKYGFDAFRENLCGHSTPLPAVVSPAVIIDTDGNWARLCAQFGVDTTMVIGAAISPSAVFIWMMDNLVAVTESRSDYGSLRLNGGMQYV